VERRLLYLDRLKIMLTVLVVLHHTAIVYGGTGGWYYYEHQDDMVANALLTIFNAVNQSFFMGLFFFISGYVSPASYDRQGARTFMSARLIRFGIPLLAYMLFIDPLLRYVSAEYEGSFGSYLRHEMLEHPWRGLLDFSTGPLWYLVALLIFFLGYIGFRRLRKGRSSKPPIALTRKIILSYLAAVIAANFLTRLVFPIGTSWLNLQLGYFPAYIGLFMAGIAAYRGQWLDRLKAETARKWGWTGFILILILPAGMAAGGALDGNTAAFMGGWSWQAAFYAAFDPLLGLGMTYWLLARFRDRRNGPASATTRLLSSNAFTVYIVHAPVVTYTAYALRQLAWSPLLKFVLVGSVSVLICFSLASLIRSGRKIGGIPRML